MLGLPYWTQGTRHVSSGSLSSLESLPFRWNRFLLGHSISGELSCPSTLSADLDHSGVGGQFKQSRNHTTPTLCYLVYHR